MNVFGNNLAARLLIRARLKEFTLSSHLEQTILVSSIAQSIFSSSLNFSSHFALGLSSSNRLLLSLPVSPSFFCFFTLSTFTFTFTVTLHVILPNLLLLPNLYAYLFRYFLLFLFTLR